MVRVKPSPAEDFDVNRQGVMPILARYFVGYCGIFFQNILRDILAKYLAGYSGKISGGIFWQNIFRNILAKKPFGIFWQSIVPDILAKYIVRYFGKISLREFWAKKINDTFQFFGHVGR